MLSTTCAQVSGRTPSYLTELLENAIAFFQTRNKRQQDTYVGPPYCRAETYAARVSCAADDAHRPPLLLGQTDGRTDKA